MDINALARELAGLQVESGYIFENGAPFCQPLTEEQAKGLLRALRDRGFISPTGRWHRRRSRKPATNTIRCTISGAVNHSPNWQRRR